MRILVAQHSCGALAAGAAVPQAAAPSSPPIGWWCTTVIHSAAPASSRTLHSHRCRRRLPLAVPRRCWPDVECSAAMASRKSKYYDEDDFEDEWSDEEEYWDEEEAPQVPPAACRLLPCLVPAAPACRCPLLLRPPERAPPADTHAALPPAHAAVETQPKAPPPKPAAPKPAPKAPAAAAGASALARALVDAPPHGPDGRRQKGGGLAASPPAWPLLVVGSVFAAAGIAANEPPQLTPLAPTLPLPLLPQPRSCLKRQPSSSSRTS